MKTIKEQLEKREFDQYINEALIDNHLKEIAKQLKNDGKSFNQIFYNIDLRWDILDSSNIKEYTPTKEVISKIRKGDVIVITYKNGKYTAIFAGGLSSLNIIDDHQYRDIPQPAAKITEKIEYISKCDKILLIEIDKDERRWQLRSDRQDARKGMVVRNQGEKTTMGWDSITSYEDYCKALAKENINRYKSIIAANKANKDEFFEQISERVNDLLKRAMNLALAISSGNKKIDGSVWEIENILSSFYGVAQWSRKGTIGYDGVLKQLQKYFSTKEELKKGKSYNISGAEENLKKLQDSLTKSCNNLEERIKKFE